MIDRDTWRTGLTAGALAGLASVVPSALAERRAGRPWWGVLAAAGTLVLPTTASPRVCLVVGAGIRVGVSLNWGLVLARFLDRRHPLAHGAAAGLALAGFQYGAIGRRRPPIRALPVLPQVADQVVYGLAAAAVLARLRGSVPSAS